MSIIGDVAERKERPAYVRFERVSVEDKGASIREGRCVYKDVDMAYVTPNGSRDSWPTKVEPWLKDMEQQVRNERLPQAWLDMYRKAYEAWKNGQELPLNGTPIKSWGVVTPAQRDTLIKMHILTVEDLAALNDEGLKRIGMGSIDLKNKANAWLSQLNDKGPLTLQMAQLQADKTVLEASVETLRRQVEALSAMTQNNNAPVAFFPQPPASEITADDMMDDTPPPPKRGKR
jgi:hypothetical protein